VGPGDLEKILEGLKPIGDERLLVGARELDDAAVYALDSHQAIVHSVDIFTPVVDEPRSYGRIAAANALSDIYAMGARALLGINVLCFSEEVVPTPVVREILEGGYEKAAEAGIAIGGGHSLEDSELKYGLSVIGIVERNRIVRNSGARAGDALVLTKPLGIGLMTTGIKFGLLKQDGIRKVTQVMEELNRTASEIMVEFGANACTDITGFGLLGHLLEMARASQVDVEIDFRSLPVMDEAYDMLRAEAIAGGLWTNKQYVMPSLEAIGLSDEEINILCDPQTSGGLLISIAEDKKDRFVEALRNKAVRYACTVGKVLAKGTGRIIVRK